jgi:hypothetical protein
MQATLNIDYLAAKNNRVWLGDCKVSGRNLIIHYGYFGKGISDTVAVYREDGKGYLLDVPPELRMQLYPVNFFRKVKLQILNVITTKNALE